MNTHSIEWLFSRRKLIMKCPVCGVEVEEGVKFCPTCGAEMEAQTPVENTASMDGELIDAAPAKDSGKIFGIVAMILGIAALAIGFVLSCSCACLGSILPMLMAIAGIVLGVVGMNMSKKAGFKNNMALVGIILSAVAIVIMIVMIIVNGAIGAMAGFTDAMMDL